MRWRTLILLLCALSVPVLLAGPPLGRVLIAGAILLAPGYLLWAIAGRDLHLPRGTALAVVVGLSLSIVPLVFLWADTLGLALTTTVLRLLLLSATLAAGWRIWRVGVGRVPPLWLAGGLSLLSVLALAVRLYQVRGAVLPLWVDSVHHGLLIRIVRETGQFPSSLRPYVEVDQLAYHWGYHVVAATWQAAARLELPGFMLLSGQVLNALHALTVYALAAYLLRSPLAGLFAGLITGLLSMMPAYYVTWGRYTQLTGLLLLPSLIILSCALLERPRLSRPLLVCTAVLLAGLILVHYRVLVFYAAFMLPYSVTLLLRWRARVMSTLWRLAGVGLLATVLVLPWSYVIFQEVLVPAAQQPGSLVGGGTYNDLDPTLLWTQNNRAIFAMAGAAALIALVTGRWRVLVLAAWIGGLFFAANPNVVGLRPLWLVNNHSVIITIFLPASVLAAFTARTMVGWLRRWAPRGLRRPLGLAVALSYVVLAGVGTWQFRDVINPVTNFAAAADLPALAWVVENSPPKARFLINAAPWLGRIYRGTDAGWWITPLAGRWTSTPPALYSYGTPEYVTEVTARSTAVANLQPDQWTQLEALIRDNGITHIFIGAKGGPLKGEMFFGRPEFQPVYDRDGVLIFEVRGLDS